MRIKIKVPNVKLPWGYIKHGDTFYADVNADGYFKTACGIYGKLRECCHLNGADWTVVLDFENRDFLRDFVSLNQIKTTLVSKQLGYSRNWLTQAMNRTDRGDLSDQELQSIMKQLHVDWTQKEFVHVKATKTHSAYRTRPCVYKHAKHKELLQRAFWDGRIVK